MQPYFHSSFLCTNHRSKGGNPMIVKVILDIPARQVNRTFDYFVPEEWQNVVKLGSRVQVPFGSMNRLGFVVEILGETDYAGELKPLTAVLDYDSYLNSELIELSEYLADYLHSFRISVLQAMLPSMLKAKYETYIEILNPEAFQAQLGAEYQESDSILLEEIEAILTPNQIEKLKRENIIKLDYRVIDQITVKTETYIKAHLSKEAYQDILASMDNRSEQQKKVISYFIERESGPEWPQNILLKETGVSNSTINTLAKKEWLKKVKKEVYRNPLSEMEIQPSQAKTLLPEQENAYSVISQSIDKPDNQTYLIEGVTGSGKTEIYLQLMEKVRAKGQGAILLVPEISLTPQMVSRVVNRFQTGVAVLHSGLSVSEKYDEWQRIIKGEATIVVGARSSIFAPLENIGIIIIDEEHETTYKQSDNPRYHARDIARWRSEYHQAPLVLGSATPSLESRSRAQVGHYTHIRLKERVNQKPMPPIELIDMTQAAVRETRNELSQTLIDKIKDRLDKKEQIVLLLNRRGYASYLLCRECGFIMGCPRCDISLTYHKSDNQMKCHYCDYRVPTPRQCPQCHSEHIRTHGIGTQKVAETLNELFPEAVVTRMDNDTTRRKGQHEKLLQEFASKQSDILLGTQMIAKGLDFENVTLVGVINADTALNIPDFRAAERTFQLLTQVSGRTGRGKLAGEVIIQTYNPDHYIMQFVKYHDYDKFFYYEMKRRHLTNYPPYYFTTLIRVSSKNNGKASQTIYDLKAQIYQPELENEGQLIIVGPNRNSVAKINNYYYYNLILKYKNKELLQTKLDQILHDSQLISKSGVFINIDHEPQFFL